MRGFWVHIGIDKIRVFEEREMPSQPPGNPAALEANSTPNETLREEVEPEVDHFGPEVLETRDQSEDPRVLESGDEKLNRNTKPRFMK